MKSIKTIQLLLYFIILFVFYLTGCANNISIKKIISKNEGELYTLTEAYECGFLSVEALKSISYYQSGEKETIDIEPIPKDPENLNSKQEEQIKITYLCMMYNETDFHKKSQYNRYNLNSIHIIGYYGTYNDVVAIKIKDDCCGYAGVLISKEIGGVQFNYGLPEILIWKYSK